MSKFKEPITVCNGKKKKKRRMKKCTEYELTTLKTNKTNKPKYRNLKPWKPHIHGEERKVYLSNTAD